MRKMRHGFPSASRSRITLDQVRWLAEVAWLSRSWRPAELRTLWRQGSGAAASSSTTLPDEVHIAEAVRWIARAQDVSGDGGITGRYLLGRGWTSSYPETTGYLVPTLLRVAKETGDGSLKERAGRCVDFLHRTQLANGAFPGGEVGEKQAAPSAFNSAQILHGLTAWYRATGDTHTLDAAHRATDWLVSIQDPDGAWRRHAYLDLPVTYSAQMSCWLAEFGAEVGSEVALDAAERNLDWVLQHQDQDSGWFDRAGFSARQHEERTAHTHTIGYVLWGTLLSAQALRRDDGIGAVRLAAQRIAASLALHGGLAGELDSQWRPRADYTCLTGNAQIALVWLRLHELSPDPVLLSAADLALDAVRRAQRVGDLDPDLSGAVAGSDPLRGAYIRNGYPNWAAKFFVDALLERSRIAREVIPPKACAR